MMTNNSESEHEKAESLPGGERIELPDLARIALAPGEVLWVRSSRLSPAQVRLVRFRLSQVFPDNQVVALSPDVELLVGRPVAPIGGATCDAETGEPCVLMLGCELPRGHTGDHYAIFEWPQEPPRLAPALNRFLPPQWLGQLDERLAQSLLVMPDKGDDDSRHEEDQDGR